MAPVSRETPRGMAVKQKPPSTRHRERAEANGIEKRDGRAAATEAAADERRAAWVVKTQEQRHDDTASRGHRLLCKMARSWEEVSTNPAEAAGAPFLLRVPASGPCTLTQGHTGTRLP